MQKVIRIDLGGVNCYLLENKGSYMLIDTGGQMFADKAYDGRKAGLRKALSAHGVTEDNLKLLVLTHGDCDHANNAAYIQKEYGALVAMAEEDMHMVRNPAWDCYKLNLRFTSFAVKIVMKMMNKKIEGLMHKVYNDFVTFEPDITLREGMSLEKYGFSGTVYSTPGHTPGSISILDNDGNLFCGDIFANNKKPSLAMNAADFEMMGKQARRLYAMPVKKIYPGHGTPFSREEFRGFSK